MDYQLLIRTVALTAATSFAVIYAAVQLLL